jgi:hypothetical protein
MLTVILIFGRIESPCQSWSPSHVGVNVVLGRYDLTRACIEGTGATIFPLPGRFAKQATSALTSLTQEPYFIICIYFCGMILYLEISTKRLEHNQILVRENTTPSK